MATLTTLTFPSGRELKKITPIKAFAKHAFYSAEEHITETIDEFSSPKEIVRSVWLVLSNQTDQKTLQLWKDWSLTVKNYFGVECKEVAIINNLLAAVLSLDNAELISRFPSSGGESFISALCDMTIRLDNCGFAYNNWSWSNFVQIGDSWKLLPSLSMERTSEPNPKLALSRLGRWLMNLNCSVLRTQPANSIVNILASGQIPDEFPEEICYNREFWKPIERESVPISLSLTQNQNRICLEWNQNSNCNTLLFWTDNKKRTIPRQLTWHSDIDQYGVSLSNIPGINPVIDADAGIAQWNRPQNNAFYQTYTITPAIKRDNWYEWGVPIVVGGPEEADLMNAYFDEDSGEVVLAPYWSDDLNVVRMYIVARSDRFAQDVNDLQSDIPLFIAERRSLNHPLRKKFNFSSQLYITAFNAVKIGNKIYFSPGQSDNCRTIIHKNSDSNDEI
ncbi:MAG: hypothetical protein IJQ39_07465 [Thermoguttaceae bacterium]|nr:hypothetical protein [Thermoguttaceae bacterium]